MRIWPSWCHIEAMRAVQQVPDRGRGGPRCWSSGEAPPASPEPSPNPPTLSGTRKRALRAAPLFARGEWRPAPPSPAARYAHSPHPPLAPSGPKQEKRIPERGKGALYRQPLRCACGRRNQRLCAAIAARSHGALRPHAPGSRLRAGGRAVGAHRPTQPGSAGNRTSAQACAARSALPAPPP